MIIDSHIHISFLRKKKNFSQVRDNLLLNMRKNRIDYSIVIPDNIANSQCADLETVMSLIKSELNLYMVGTLRVSQVNKVNLLKIEKLFQKKIIRGFKIFPGHDPVYPTDKRWCSMYKLCVKYNFPLIIHTGINVDNRRCAKYNDPKHIIKVAEKYPKLKIIIAHYFWPKLDYCFSITNGFDNIYFDTSALADPEVIRMSGGIKKMKEVLTKTIKRRVKSVLFGTDWPIGNVKKHINLINSLRITEEEKHKVFYKNALYLFNL
ncbi:amidohydrolase family protein [Patescibacteria group bacterium]|nr:amidohydrolase family protein [Patescibacteria group bacterium]